MEKHATERWQERNDFIVRLPLDRSICIMDEVGCAFKLYWWYLGRVTVGFITEQGVRCGGVLGLRPVTDFDIADNMSRMGGQCTEDQIYHWRHTLKNWGYTGWKRTPGGQQTFVIEAYYPLEKSTPPPEWAVGIIADLIERRLAHSAKIAEWDVTESWPNSATQTATIAEQTAVVAEQTAKIAEIDQRSSEVVSEYSVTIQEASEPINHENEKPGAVVQSDGKCPRCHVDKPKRPDPSGIVACSLCGELYRQSAKEQSEVRSCQ